MSVNLLAFAPMIVIGLTGGIGTGKTTVSNILKAFGADIISTDEIGHGVYKRGTKGFTDLIKEFGNEIVGTNGEVDRSRLGTIVFQSPRALLRLNDLVHPKVQAMLKDKILELGKQDRDLIVVEAALLMEAHWEHLVDEIWVTTAPMNLVIQRTMLRDKLSHQEVLARIRTQSPRKDLLTHADAIIDNRGTIQDLRLKVKTLWDKRFIHPEQ